jgi:hypothetical protein
VRSLGQLLRYHRHLEVDCAGWLHRILLEEVRDHAYEHIDSLRTIDVRTIVGREDARKYRLKHVVVFFHSVKKMALVQMLKVEQSEAWKSPRIM